ncbi:hypothetical protein ACQF36_12335 [Streptomyces sp. Marseille-Q5077]|uniref:hypothetical protein n=1 Tax=Streptomyces sp. Marseille-Q5077 TaxID=3418995 RepID=UPI003D091099
MKGDGTARWDGITRRSSLKDAWAAERLLEYGAFRTLRRATRPAPWTSPCRAATTTSTPSCGRRPAPLSPLRLPEVEALTELEVPGPDQWSR